MPRKLNRQTTKQQSATIFGLTTALSSKQLYNIQGRIGSDNIEHLHYFAEMAVSAARSGRATSQSTAPPFQSLQLLVRDWPCFDDETFDDPVVSQRFLGAKGTN